MTKRGHWLVVPEVVVWEWAEQARETVRAVAAEMEDATRRVESSLGVDLVVPEVPDIDTLIERITKVLAELGVEIAVPEAEEAMSAVKQQVLQRGTGSKKAGVKTGTADALVLSAAKAQLGNADAVVLCTADKALGDRAMAASEQIQVANSKKTFWPLLAKVSPAVADLVKRMESFLMESSMEMVAAGPDPFIVGPVDMDLEVEEQLGLNLDASVQLDASIEQVMAMSLHDVDVITDDEPPFAQGEARVRCLVMIASWYTDADGTLTDEWTSTEVNLHTYVTVDLDANHVPVDFEVDAPAQLVAVDK
ncbi:MAG: hypothetical protein GY798_25475 [Hyphomicrobiales bacterium]|nr:hypothetical protein [Hyphomicrobiales bacterium]